MNKLFNIDIDDLIADYKISYQNKNDNFINQIHRLNNNVLKIYTHKVNEYNKLLKQLSDVKNKINSSQKKLHDITNKVEYEGQILQSETNRLESNNDKSRLLEVEENDLKNTIYETKLQLTQALSEKKESIRKIKREIKAFTTGVNKFEQFLKLSMNINNEKSNVVINITMKKLNNSTNYNVILEETENDLKLIDITPSSPTIIKATSLYNQNKDIQGLLAFLYNTEK